MYGRTYRLLLLVLLHQYFIVLASLERPPHFFPCRLYYPIQGSILGGVRFYNPNGIKHTYRIEIVPIAVDVLLVSVLAAIVIFLLEIISPTPSFFVFGDGSVTFIHFLPEAIDRMVQQKRFGCRTLSPQTIDADLVYTRG